MAILAVAVLPLARVSVRREKERELRNDLYQMRDAIDKFYGDKGRYPSNLEELVTTRYIRTVPVDPMTESTSTWVVLPPPADMQAKGEVYDVKSGATGTASDGTSMAEW